MGKIFKVLCYLSLTIALLGCSRDIVDLTSSISGVVKDAELGTPLQNCRITLTPSGLTTTTIETGSFIFERLEPGQYSIGLAADDYEPVNKTYNLKANTPISDVIFLNPLLQNITVSPEALYFGDISTNSEIFITKENTRGSVQFSARTDAEWISITPTSGILSSSEIKLSVIIDRSGLSVGNYTKTIYITTAKGDISIPVHVDVVQKSAPKITNSGGIFDLTDDSFKVKALITSNGGYEITNYGHCWSMSSSPTVNSNKTTYGNRSNAGEYTSTITNLTAGQTYYVRGYATNYVGTTYTEQLSVTIPKLNAPTVTTMSAYNIQGNTAIISGQATGESITECGFYYGTTSNPSTRQPCSSVSTNFSLQLNGLTEGTVYYYKAYAVNSKGETSGQTKSFTTTSPSAPKVTTDAASNINKTAAQLNATIVAGDIAVSEYGFYYGTSSNPTSKITVGTSNKTGSYSYSLSGLKEGTKYYIRAYIRCSSGEICGQTLSFTTTSDTNPTVTTNNAEDIGYASANLNGNIAAGTISISEYGFYYGTSSSNPSLRKVVGSTNYSGAFKSSITNLEESTTYYYKAYARTANGFIYGGIKSFKTSAKPNVSFSNYKYTITLTESYAPKQVIHDVEYDYYTEFDTHGESVIEAGFVTGALRSYSYYGGYYATNIQCEVKNNAIHYYNKEHRTNQSAGSIYCLSVRPYVIVASGLYYGVEGWVSSSAPTNYSSE